VRLSTASNVDVSPERRAAGGTAAGNLQTTAAPVRGDVSSEPAAAGSRAAASLATGPRSRPSAASPSPSRLSLLHAKLAGEAGALAQPTDDSAATEAGEVAGTVEGGWSPGWLPFTGIYLAALLALAGGFLAGGGAIDWLRRKVALG
jgi:hypothetical protein